jgi:hypothetical protein
VAAFLEVTPKCEATGLPLLILPKELAEKRALLSFNERLSRNEDFHHPWSPNSDPALQGLAGRALRYSFGQDINRTLHCRYTSQFGGPLIPADKFQPIIWSLAGVLPREALFLPTDGGYERITLTNNEYSLLASTVHPEKHFHRKYGVARRRMIGRFFAWHILEQNLEGVISRVAVEQFLDRKTSDQRRKELGNQIITNLLNESVSDLTPTYQELNKEGYVAPNRIKALGKAVRSFFTKDYYQAYHDELAKNIESSSLQTSLVAV